MGRLGEVVLLMLRLLVQWVQVLQGVVVLWLACGGEKCARASQVGGAQAALAPLGGRLVVHHRHSQVGLSRVLPVVQEG